MNMAPALMSFCERAVAGFPTFPADTWSNLGPLCAGLFLLRKGLGQGGQRGIAAIGGAGVFMAFGSILFHGTATRIGELVDVTGMCVWIAVIFGLSLTRVGLKVAPATLIAGLSGAAVVAISSLAPVASLATFTLFAVGVCVTEITRASIAGERLTALGLAGVSVGLAFVAWYLDERRIICDPDNHVLTLHSVWHLLNALPLLFVASHFFPKNPAAVPAVRGMSPSEEFQS